MTITLDIRPEIEAVLARQAAVRGLGVGAYVANLLEEAAAKLPTASNAPSEPKNMAELFAPLQGLNLNFERDRDPGRDLSL